MARMHPVMLKKVSAAVLAAALALWSISCSERPGDNESYSSSGIETRIRSLASTDLEAAMDLVDEELKNGRLSPFAAYELRSKLTYQYSEDYPEAAKWLHRALDQEEAQDPRVRAELLYHLANILKSGRDFTACLATCSEGKELAHESGERFLKHSFDFMAGICLFAIGEDDSGLEMMKEAIAGASASASGESDYGHLVHFSRSLASDLIEIQDYPAALEEWAENERFITKMEKLFPDTSPEYLDRSRFYLEVGRAICYARTGQTPLAEESFAEALKRDLASTEGGKCWLVDYYAAIGDPASILDIYLSQPFAEADTVSRAFRYRLGRLRDAYANAGLTEEAWLMAERHERISALIEEKEAAEGVREKAVQYDAQQYRLALGDTLSSLKKYRRGITFLLCLLTAVFAIFILLNRTLSRRKEERHQRETAALEKDVRSLQKQVSLIAERELSVANPGGNRPKAVSFPEMIEGQQMYLNKSLNRDSAATLLGMTQTEITKALSEIQPGLSFPEYIKGLRIRHALQLLGENPDIPIADLADRCGFYTTRTLQRSFRAVTGKTPSQYARGLKLNL